MGIVEIITAIFNDMWIGLQNFEGGFIIAFLGIGAILLSVISGIVGLLQQD
ncbi:MAG: hypothetical protein WC871_09765 [Bacteroidales bacterium]|jgi:hypothetical protein